MKEKIKKYLPYLIIFILGMVLMFLVKCEPEPVVRDSRTTAKTEQVKVEKKEVKELEKAEVKKDSIRIKYIIKWHEIKTFLPSDSLVIICDSIIKIDSSQIVLLKEINAKQDTIIKHQDVIIHSDSLDIVCLKKALRKQKRKTKFVAAGLGILLGASLVR